MAKKKVKKNVKKFEIARRSDVDPTALLPVIQNLAGYGFSVADIGCMLGYSGSDPEQWLYRLQEKYPDVKEALTVGKTLGDIELVKTAIEECFGYWVEEEETQYKNVPKFTTPTPTGKPGKLVDRYISEGKKKKKRYVPPDKTLLWKILCSRMPEYFSETKKLEINKKSIEIKAETEEEIKAFAGKLMKIIDAEVIDTETDN